MKRNPVMPYALIAVLGLTLMIVIAFVGLNQMDQAGEGHGGEEQSASEGGEGGSSSADPEQIYSQNCASCHGADLSGTAGPSLKTIGSSLSKDEIVKTITNGVQGTAMPAFEGQLKEGQIDSLATWLSKKK